jgi:hypothetical protein
LLRTHRRQERLQIEWEVRLGVSVHLSVHELGFYLRVATMTYCGRFGPLCLRLGNETPKRSGSIAQYLEHPATPWSWHAAVLARSRNFDFSTVPDHAVRLQLLGSPVRGRLAQLEEHSVYTRKVIGSSPIPPTPIFHNTSTNSEASEKSAKMRFIESSLKVAFRTPLPENF